MDSNCISKTAKKRIVPDNIGKEVPVEKYIPKKCFTQSTPSIHKKNKNATISTIIKELCDSAEITR